MSVNVSRAVWRCENLRSQLHKMVLLALADFADDDGKCFPKMETLAIKCCISRRSVISIIGDLEAAKYLTYNHSTGRKSEAKYRLTIECGAVLLDKRAACGRKPKTVNDIHTKSDEKCESDYTETVNDIPINCESHYQKTVNHIHTRTKDEPPIEPSVNHQREKSACAPPSQKPPPFVENEEHPTFGLASFRWVLKMRRNDDPTWKEKTKAGVVAWKLRNRTEEEWATFEWNWWNLDYRGRDHSSSPTYEQMQNEFDSTLQLKAVEQKRSAGEKKNENFMAVFSRGRELLDEARGVRNAGEGPCALPSG